MEVWNLVFAFLTVIVGFVLIKLISKQVNRLKRTKQFKRLISKSGYNVAILWYSSYFIKLALYVIVSLIAISFLGFAQQILTLIAVVMTLSIIGVLVYSLRDLIPSAFAGAYLMHSKVVKKGDKISIKGFKGIVKEVSLLTITIKDNKGGLILVPNKIIMERVLKKNKK